MDNQEDKINILNKERLNIVYDYQFNSLKIFECAYSKTTIFVVTDGKKEIMYAMPFQYDCDNPNDTQSKLFNDHKEVIMNAASCIYKSGVKIKELNEITKYDIEQVLYPNYPLKMLVINKGMENVNLENGEKLYNSEEYKSIIFRLPDIYSFEKYIFAVSYEIIDDLCKSSDFSSYLTIAKSNIHILYACSYMLYPELHINKLNYLRREHIELVLQKKDKNNNE